MDTNALVNVKKVSSETIVNSDEIHSCKTPMEELKSIKLCDMKVPMIYKGNYLVCKVVKNPLARICTRVGIHDLNDNFAIVDLYNFRYNLDDVEWISPGTIFIIKEPCVRDVLKYELKAIDIFSPTDVIFVDPADAEFLDKIGAKKWYESMSKDAEVWKNEANEFFKDGKYEKAIFLYERAIRCNPENPILYLNKSMACLKTGAFYMAYEAAKHGLEKGGDREKALYRMGQAAYGMREWKKAADHFLEVLKEFPANEFASKELKRATSRLTEERNGKFDFKSIFVESKKEKAELDVADYKGPIEIANIPGKGRGMIATKDIKEGTLLAVSKSFASAYEQDLPVNLIPEISEQVLTPTNVKAKELYDLYSGDDNVPNDEIPFGIVDAFRIKNICRFNCFGFQDKDGQNSFYLHIPSSYFNHSCLGNAFNSFYGGNVMVIHAAADIKKGEEICFSYGSPYTAYLERKKKFEKWKFQCDCKLCETDANDKLCSKRDQMFEEFEEYVKANKNDPQKIRETYVKRSKFQLTLSRMLVSLASLHSDIGNFSTAIQYLEEALTLMDGPFKYGLNISQTCVNLALCYAPILNIQKAKEMTKKAFKYSLCTDLDHFKTLFPYLSVLI
uniref:SET domain-containing protein n=1 Tax=Panagrolaimus davidi TaxID=227884 RepID=A0A914Q547_9BILA